MAENKLITFKSIGEICDIGKRRGFNATDINGQEYVCFNPDLRTKIPINEPYEVGWTASRYENGKPMISEAKSTGKVVTPPDAMSKDDWAEKDRVKSSSIEAQKAGELGILLYIAYINAGKEPTNPDSKKLIERARGWAISKLPETSKKMAEAVVEKLDEEP